MTREKNAKITNARLTLRLAAKGHELLKPKTKHRPGPSLYASVASGEVEIGFQQISEILAEPSVEFIGALPPAIQNITQFAAGIIASSTQADAGKALVGFLSSPASVAVMKAKGFE